MPTYMDSQGNFIKTGSSKIAKKLAKEAKKQPEVAPRPAKTEPRFKERSTTVPAVRAGGLTFNIKNLFTPMGFKTTDCSGSIKYVDGYSLKDLIDLLVIGEHPNKNQSTVLNDSRLATRGAKSITQNCNWTLNQIRKAGKQLVKNGDIPVSPFHISYRQTIKKNQVEFDKWLDDLGYDKDSVKPSVQAAGFKPEEFNQPGLISKQSKSTVRQQAAKTIQPKVSEPKVQEPVVEEVKAEEPTKQVEERRKEFIEEVTEDLPAEKPFKYLTVDKSLAEIDGDKQKAELFLTHEKKRKEVSGKPARKGLITKLNKIIEG